MTYRILRANRARIDGPSLGSLALHAAAFLLTLIGALGRRKVRKNTRERLSAVTEREYDEWLTRQKRRMG